MHSSYGFYEWMWVCVPVLCTPQPRKYPFGCKKTVLFIYIIYMKKNWGSDCLAYKGRAIYLIGCHFTSETLKLLCNVVPPLCELWKDTVHEDAITMESHRNHSKLTGHHYTHIYTNNTFISIKMNRSRIPNSNCSYFTACETVMCQLSLCKKFWCPWQ